MRGRTASTLTLVLVCAFGTPARGDQTYHVSGKDRVNVSAIDANNEIAYDGTETLVVQRGAKSTHYIARVRYNRTDRLDKSGSSGSSIAELLPSGEQIVSVDRDPDQLTVLNQPFAVQLDTATMSGLKHPDGATPLNFSSLIAHSSMRCSLSRIGDAIVDRKRAVGVTFAATGPLHGRIPGGSQRLAGTITLKGTAYYDLHSSLLLALDTTLVVSGKYVGAATDERILIVSRRSMRATEPSVITDAMR